MKIPFLITINFILLLAFSCMPVNLLAQEDCILKKEEDKIKVYSCRTENSSFKTIRAEYEINCTVDEYLFNAMDVEHFKDWHFREINPILLQRISDMELIYYTEVSAPFPVSNRDLILHLTVNRNQETKSSTITIKSEPNYLPEKENRVRVQKSYSEIKLFAVNESKLRVEYFIQIDPGGNIPAWLVNLFSTQGPYETFKNLIERLETKTATASRK